MLKALSDFDLLLFRGVSAKEALHELRMSPLVYNRSIVDALGAIELPELKQAFRLIKISHLRAGMILSADIRSLKNNTLVAGKGQMVNEILQQQLLNFLAKGAIAEEARVMLTTDEA